MEPIETETIFIFNSTLKSLKIKPNDDEVQDAKLLYYHPIEEELIIKRSNLGIIEGTLSFLDSFEKTEEKFLYTELNNKYFIANCYEENFLLCFIIKKYVKFSPYENINTKKEWIKNYLDNFHNMFCFYHHSFSEFFLSKKNPNINYPLSNNKNLIFKDFIYTYLEYIKNIKLPFFNNMQYLKVNNNTQTNILFSMQKIKEKIPEISLLSAVYKGKIIYNEVAFDSISLLYNLFYEIIDTSAKINSFKAPVNEVKEKEEKINDKKEEDKKEEKKEDNKEENEKENKKEENKEENQKEEKKEDNKEENEKENKKEENKEENQKEEKKDYNKEEIKIEKNKDVEMKKEEYKEEDKQNDININPNNDLKENINPNEIILTNVSPFRKLFGVSLLQEGYLLGPSPDIKPKIFIPKIYIKSMEEQEYKLLIYYFKGITLFMFLKNDINIDLIQFNQIKEIIKKILSNELINEMEKSHKQINELFNIFSVNSSDKSFKISGIFSKNNREINYFLQKILFVNNNVFLNSLTYFKGGYNFKGGYIYYLNSIGRKVVFILNDSLSINQIRSEIDKNEKECDFIFLI